MRFDIGQAVWTARYENSARKIECPDCGGTGRIRVTFHDDTTVSIDCQNCAPGYEPPTGKVTVYDSRPAVLAGTVTGVRISGGQTEWEIAPHWIASDEDVFGTEAEAMARAEVKAKEAESEAARIFAMKEKPQRKWAWNASYHRQCIKRAHKDIAYHTAKLNVADLKAKAEKKEKSDA